MKRVQSWLMSKAALFLKILFTFVLLCALFWLARVGIADFMRLAPSVYIEEIQKGKTRPSAPELTVARNKLLAARAWDAGNPLIPEYLGQIAIIRAQMIFLSPLLQAKLFREAIADFDDAIALRPNSAYLWADRMTAGSLLLEVNEKTGPDTQLAQQALSKIGIALKRASELGPWEPKVLTQVVRVGKLRYDAFTPETRACVDAAVVRADKLGIKIK